MHLLSATPSNHVFVPGGEAIKSKLGLFGHVGTGPLDAASNTVR